MKDLNILGMMRGDPPGYSLDMETNPQRLMVLLMVSDKDAGRDYGGGFASMAGEVNDPDAVSLEVSSSLGEALEWMMDNSDTVPDDFTASVEDAFAEYDHLTVTINAGTEDGNTPVNLTIG